MRVGFAYCSLIGNTSTVLLECKWSRNMPYVYRNEEGDITFLLDSPNHKDDEWLEPEHSDVVAFSQHEEKEKSLKESLNTSDADMARVLEDVIDVLMEKQVFNFTELPDVVQEKLNMRKKLRQDVNALSNLIEDDDGIL